MNTAALQAIRDIASRKAAAYSHVLFFTRRFTSGTLAGLTHDDSIGFCNEADAHEWVATINASKKLSYRVESWKVVAS